MDVSRGPPGVKNKAPAPVQISAEQLLREAVDRQEVALQAPTRRFEDLEELHEYQGRKRRDFEEYIRRNRQNLNNWLRYAQWEMEQKDMARARSVFERALDVHPNSPPLWLRYSEAEMKNRNVNHARNVLDRAVTRLPRCDKVWYRYVYMEEMLGNIAGTRQVFARWMEWRPDEAAWSAYIKLEKRYGEWDRAREIFRIFAAVHPEPRTWLKWAKFEEENGTNDTVREVFGSAVETLGDDFVDERLFIAYARFEARRAEYERARAIYKYALDRLPRSKSVALHKAYTTFEKQFGDQDGIENVVLAKRRAHYEEQARQNPRNYDTWIDYVRLEETSGDVDRIREIYERAVAQVPAVQEKRYWRRYVYLWLFYAIWEETEARSIGRARQVYQTLLSIIPHAKFTFSKAWLQAARFEVRHGELTAARRLLGRSIGMRPKDKLFRDYIELEHGLFEFNRCRILHEKHVEWNPSNCQAWIKYAHLELAFEDFDRTRGIFELAIAQPELDMPELLWKEYIDFEEGEGEYERTRNLYERLLEKTDHVKVWISYARFEISVPDQDGEGEGGARNEEEDDDDKDEDEEQMTVSDAAKKRVRRVFQRAHDKMRDKNLKEDRRAILAAWLEFEEAYGNEDEIASVQRQMPRKTKRRQRLDDGTFEERIDYVFPADDRQAQNMSSLLAMAQQWKQTAVGGGGGAEASRS